MRRLSMVAALLALAACSDNPAPPAGVGTPGGATTPAVSAPPGVPGGADRKTVCAAYGKVEGEAGAKLVTILPRAAEALGDPAKAQPVIAELKGVLVDYEKGLAAEANRSADGALRGAIEADLGAIKATQRTIEASGTDMEKVVTSLNSPEFQRIGEKVKTLCEVK